MNKTDLHLLWVLLAGLGIGVIAYGVFQAIFTQAPPPAVPHYMMRPEPPEEKFGYDFAGIPAESFAHYNSVGGEFDFVILDLFHF